MPNAICQEKSAVSNKRILSWDDAIEDAKQRLKDIQFSLKVFQKRKRIGEPWPGDVAGTEKKSVPARG
jgi:hypothetical protein